MTTTALAVAPATIRTFVVLPTNGPLELVEAGVATDHTAETAISVALGTGTVELWPLPADHPVAPNHVLVTARPEAALGSTNWAALRLVESIAAPTDTIRGTALLIGSMNEVGNWTSVTEATLERLFVEQSSLVVI